MPIAIAPDSPILHDYHATLANLQKLGKTHEQATRIAFSTLLDSFSKTAGWTLVLEDALSNRKRPDGALLDNFGLPRGHWEAKDLGDDLDAEIKKKKKIQYPLANTIFENTQRAVLYQNGRETAQFDLRKTDQVASLLTSFFNHTDQDIEGFHQAVSEFQNRIPTLAGALQKIIEAEPEQNPAFKNAFASFHELCRQALNPTIAREAIEEMLVQHLLTERLIRNVFNNPQFTSRNVIAGEIETVIGALTSRNFNREEFLISLDPFYKEIENVGRKITDWSEKQHFLNTIYERFFQGYSTSRADTMGIVYTPQPIVDWMCASVDRVLQEQFGQSLSTRGVRIIDGCVGTGNFIVNLLRRINGRDLPYKYANDIFCNEIMLLPYYIASLNIEHEYFERTKTYKGFEGICFADTLDLSETNLFSEENTVRIKRQKAAKLKVVIGNPPYNVGQKNENDNNKNRKYPLLDRRIKDTYAKASNATNKNALADPYVKFFRWASDRLNGDDGIVCFVSNNSFADQIAFDGMRKHLATDFDQIYHLDLHGNVRQNPKLSGTTHNVFGIQVGVGITIAVRKKGAEKAIKYFRVPEDWRKTQKLEWLKETKDIGGVDWSTLSPDAKNNWLTAGMHDEFETFLPMGTKAAKAHWGVTVEAIFKNYSRGAETTRDSWMYDFNHEQLSGDARSMIETYNAEVDRWISAGRPKPVDDFVLNDETKIKWSSRLKECLQRGEKTEFKKESIRHATYRPFTRQLLYFDNVMTHRQGQIPKFFPTSESENENSVIWLKVGSDWPMFSLMTNHIPDLLPQGGSQCFPFYTYAEDGSNRTENITDWALEKFRAEYSDDAISKRDIFHYVYALLHHPAYREKYAENLNANCRACRSLREWRILGSSRRSARLWRICI